MEQFQLAYDIPKLQVECITERWIRILVLYLMGIFDQMRLSDSKSDNVNY